MRRNVPFRVGIGASARCSRRGLMIVFKGYPEGKMLLAWVSVKPRLPPLTWEAQIEDHSLEHGLGRSPGATLQVEIGRGEHEDPARQRLRRQLAQLFFQVPGLERRRSCRLCRLIGIEPS